MKPHIAAHLRLFAFALAVSASLLSVGFSAATFGAIRAAHAAEQLPEGCVRAYAPAATATTPVLVPVVICNTPSGKSI